MGLWEEASPYVTETALIRTCWKPRADSDHNLQTQECDLLPAAGVESAACTLAQVVSRSAAAGRRVGGRSTSPALRAGNSRRQQKSIEGRRNLTLHLASRYTTTCDPTCQLTLEEVITILLGKSSVQYFTPRFGSI